MKKKIIGLGAGGHAKVIIEILQMKSEFEIKGLLDPNPELIGKKILGIPVLGSDDLLNSIKKEGVSHFFIGVGSIKNTAPRKRLFETALKEGLMPANAIHPQSIISGSAEIGAGITVMAGAIINTQAKIEQNVIINTGAIIEHDCHIYEHVHIATGAKLAGKVYVERGAHIGAGATIIQCIHIGQKAIVGAGSVVIEDIPECSTVAGSPARVIKRTN